MIPLNRTQAMLVAQKRRGTLKVTCVFCDRRIGWLTSEQVGGMLMKWGLPICDDCLVDYKQYLTDGQENVGWPLTSRKF